MTQHFVRSAAARPLPLATVLRMSEDQAHRWFCRARWYETDGEPQCPRCGSVGAWKLRRRRYRCREKGCRADFSVTSGTIFAHRKLQFRQILAAISLSVNAAKGRPALQVARELGVQYKTAWITLMKLREAIAAEREGVQRDERYLDLYAAERAWRRDHRRTSNRTLVEEMLKRALGHPGTSSLRGYWQGHRRNGEARPRKPERSCAARALPAQPRQEHVGSSARSRSTSASLHEHPRR